MPLFFLVAAHLCVAGSLLTSLSARASWIPERRDVPAKTESGYLAFPVFSHIPGIGSTYGAGFLASNIAKTRVNAYSAALTGDTRALLFGVNEIHLIPNTMIFSFIGYGTRIPFQIHDRGVDAPKENFFYLMKKEYGGSMNVDLHFWQRRLQLGSKFGGSRLMPDGMKTPGGLALTNADARESDALTSAFSLTLDLTDDDRDPRKGFNIQLSRNEISLFDGLHSRSHTLNGSLTAYIPLPHKSVWAFNVFRSSAFVTNRNTLTEADLRQSLGLNCGSFDEPTAQAKCTEVEDRRVKERLAENEYGTAGLLGGPTQLRGFPLGRFRGSQTLMYATEMRLNLSDENTKFDLGFMEGSRSFFQIAPFFEMGATSDPPDAVEAAHLQSAYGIGFRFGFSGAVIRADAGFSRDGSQFTFYVGYPWAPTDF